MDDGRTITKGNTKGLDGAKSGSVPSPQASRPPPGDPSGWKERSLNRLMVEDRETSMEGCQTPNTTPRQLPTLIILAPIWMTPVRASPFVWKLNVDFLSPRHRSGTLV